MTNLSLLNLNVDTLFEQHNVPEIDIVHKKVQAVVEKKREELRTMVGERYRDLLQAADTIATMQESSSTLITQVQNISSNCRSLNEQQLIGFKTNEDVITSETLANRNASKQLSNYFSTMVQVKMLTALPELIWSHIDRLNFYTATELYVFSCHISTGLQLDAHNPIMRQLPVAKKQWEILKPFHITIKQNVLAVLEREDISDVVMANCLLSLMLLEKSTMNAVLTIFLQFRCIAYEKSLTGIDQCTDATGRRRAKHCILASLKVLNEAVELIAKCFLGNESLLTRKIKELADPTSPATICYMVDMDSTQLKMLPDIITEFRPKFNPQSISDDHVRSALDQWLQQVQTSGDAKLKPLFTLITNMNVIQEIKNEASSYQNKIPAVIERLGLENRFDFYNQKYVPLINQRIRDIIQTSCTESIKTLFSALQQDLPTARTQELPIWQDDVNDVPLSLEEALSGDPNRKRLLMRMRGYNSTTINICKELDRQLAVVVSEIDPLLQEDNSQTDDKLKLIQFLRECVHNQLVEFLNNVKGLNLMERNQILYIIRMCGAICELCPHLKVCFCPKMLWREWVNSTTISINASEEHWSRICSLFEEECFTFWQQLVDDILTEHPCSNFVCSALTSDMVLEDFTRWDTVSLEQKDDQGNAVHSSIHIPNQPRISLQSYLFTLISALNEVVPQTLPTKVRLAFNAKLLQQLLNHYANYTTTSENAAEVPPISQKIALQIYFDLKFLQQVFCVRRDDRYIFDQFQTQQSKLKDLIDPFDFELFAEPLANNVKIAVSRLQSQFGVLTPHSIPPTATANKQQQNIKSDLDPNVLILSASASTALWFPLLPIIAPSAAVKEIMSTSQTEKSSASSTPTRTSKKKAADSAPQPATTTAAKPKSFFGAMSQEWFR